MFDISFFRQNPLPFYTLAHELYPGKYRPTYAHCFVRLLHDKGLLLKLFTQNIDCLEREAGVPEDQIIEAHGSFAKQRCIECRTEFPGDLMREHVSNMEVPHCPVPNCNGLVKPDIVFFGESLPQDFHRNAFLPSQADLGIVMGTSLTVYPFAGLAQGFRDAVPRLLINNERVGDFGYVPQDVVLLGEIDDKVRQFVAELGWTEELNALWQRMNPSKALSKKQEEKKSRDEAFREHLDSVTKEIDERLKIWDEHKTNMVAQLAREGQKSIKIDKPEPDAKTPLVLEREEGGLDHVFPHFKANKL